MSKHHLPLVHPTCSTCKHFWEEACHESPPQVTVIIVPQPGNIASGGRPGMGPVPVAAFPPIAEPTKIGCSRHSPELDLSH